MVVLYLDGAQVATQANVASMAPYTGTAWIGGDASTLGGKLLGMADEVVLYDVALTGAQIQELYDRGNQGLGVPH